MTDPASSDRRVVTGVLIDWLKNESFPDRNLSRIKDNRARYVELIYGTVKQHRLLEHLLGELTDKMPPLQIRASLLSGLYECLFMHTSEHAVVNETVELVKSHGGKRAGGFANAVLRRAYREKEDILDTIETLDPALRYSHPQDAYNRWVDQFGADDANAFCEWNNERSRVVARMRPGHDLNAYITDATESGFELERHPFKPDSCFYVPRGIQVTDLPGFKDGQVTIQDPSTLASIDLLNPSAGDRVLDACAAPGGKSALLSERVGTDGKVIAVDLHGDRLKRLQQNCDRLKLTNVEILQADAAKGDDLKAVLGGISPDAILADVPCSNSGVLQRRPDARWRLDPTRLKTLHELQRSILDGLAKLPISGGVLVYSTCSIEPAENQELIADWLKENPAYSLEKEVNVLPWRDQADGAYAARLVKS